jgi:hypothetical protein
MGSNRHTLSIFAHFRQIIFLCQGAEKNKAIMVGCSNSGKELEYEESFEYRMILCKFR